MDDTVVHLRGQAALLLKAGQYADAENAFRQVIESGGATANDYHELGRALQPQGEPKYRDAIRQFAKAYSLWHEEHSPDQTVALYNWANSLQLNGDLAQAEAKCRQVLEYDDTYAPAQNLLGLILRAAGEQQYPAAIAAFKRATELWKKQGSPDLKLALFNWAETLFLQKKYPEAEQVARDLVGAAADFADGQNLLGRTLKHQGREKYPAALKQFQKARQLWQQEKSFGEKLALYNWADLLREQKEFEQAELRCREALTLDMNYGYGHNLLGLILMGQGRQKYPAAAEQFAEAEQLWQREGSVDRSAALSNWVDVLRFQGKLSEAETKCREILRLDANDASGHNRLGLIFQDQGKDKFEIALAEFELADRLWKEQASPERTYALTNAGELLRRMRRYPEAEAKYRDAIAIDPTSPSTHNSLGGILQDQGREKYPAAIECFEKAAGLWKQDSPKDHAYALGNIADTLRFMERFTEAESKCREAIAVDPDYASGYNILGLALQGQGKDKYPAAVEAFAKAEALWKIQEPKNRRYPLQNWSWLLAATEDYEQALEKMRLAVEADPDGLSAHYNFGNALADAGLYLDAFNAYDKAIQREQDDPYAYHNKAHFLFYLGRYDKGWEAWHYARGVYERALKAGLHTPLDIERATHFASVLSGHYVERQAAEQWYRTVLAAKPDHLPAITGLATLYSEWSQSEKPSATATAQRSHAVKRGLDALKARLGTGDDFRNAMDLANFCIDTDDFVAAADWLATAEAACGASVARRAEMASRCGVLYAKREQFDKAIERFQEALRGNPPDLKSRTNLAEAYLKLKQFGKAEEEYRRVLAVAEGNIEALIGTAQVCIELAEGGEIDRCAQAEKHLTAAIQCGYQSAAGSKRLVGKELAQVYYLRGYVRVKRYESDGAGANLSLLKGADDDFDKCRKLDRISQKADAALAKLRKKLAATRREKLFDFIGPFMVCLAATAMFVFAQMDFFFHGREPFGIDWFKTQRVKEPGYYALLSFGALVFMVAGLYLPKVLKLKVGAIELEKGAVEQISTPTSLGISR